VASLADLGTILIGNETTALNNGTTGVGGVTGSTPYLEAISGTDDATSYIEETTNATATQYDLYMALDAFPSDLGNVDTLKIQVRYAHLSGTANLTWDQLSCRIYKSDLTTALTDELVIHNGHSSATWTSSSVLDFVNEDTAATKAEWNEAVIYFYWDKTRTKGGNAGADMAITAAEITGTYTVGAAGRIMSSLAGAGGLAGHGGLAGKGGGLAG
jgi:hypothetical protein